MVMATALFGVLSCQTAKPQPPPLTITQRLTDGQGNFVSDCKTECPRCDGSSQPQSVLGVVAGAIGFFVKTLVDE